VFDPERDQEPQASAFYLRIAVLVGLGLVIGLVLWPSVSRFSAPDGSGEDCVAVVDAWGPSSPSPREAACRPPSRTRVLISGAGIGVLVVVFSATAVAAGMRHGRRRPQRLAASSSG
jgi:hypothetical protein